MTEYKSVLERVGSSAPEPDLELERILRRRDRRRRNQRFAAGVVGIGVFAAAVLVVLSGGSLDRTGTPVLPAGSGTTGPAETGPAVSNCVVTRCTETGPAEIGPAETGPTVPVGEFSTDSLLDLETGEMTPLPFLAGGKNGDLGRNGYAVSPDGSEVAYYVGADPEGMDDGPRGLFVARIDGTHARQIDNAIVPGVSDTLYNTGPAWSPDGTKIAYVGRPSRDVGSNIFVVDLASGVNTQVTFETVPVSGTAFSPDGSSIVYFANLPGGS